MSDFKPNSIDKQAVLNDQIGKTKMKKSGDEKHRVKEVRLNIGDQVLVKQKRTNKSMSHYDPVPFTIVDVTIRKHGDCSET